MLAIAATIGWIVFDIIATLVAFPAMTTMWLIFLGGGVSLGALALFAEIHGLIEKEREKSAHHLEILDLKHHHERETADLKQVITNSHANLSGQMTILAVSGTRSPVTPSIEENRGFEGDVQQISVIVHGENARMVYFGLEIRNKGRAGSLRQWSLSYRSVSGMNVMVLPSSLSKIDVDQVGKSARNLAYDEEVYPERGLRRGFVALVVSNEEAGAMLKLDTADVKISFQDIEGRTYDVLFPPPEIRERLRSGGKSNVN